MENEQGYEFGPVIPQQEFNLGGVERAGLMYDISERSNEAALESAAETIGQDNNLFAMMSTLMEKGPSLGPDTRDHLRRMIAVHVDGFLEAAVNSGNNIRLYEDAAFEVRDEMNEMSELPQDSDSWPMEWNFAMEDAASLNGHDIDTIDMSEFEQDYHAPSVQETLEQSEQAQNAWDGALQELEEKIQPETQETVNEPTEDVYVQPVANEVAQEDMARFEEDVRGDVPTWEEAAEEQAIIDNFERQFDDKYPEASSEFSPTETDSEEASTSADDDEEMPVAA